MANDVIYNLNIVVSSALITITLIFALVFYNAWRKQARTENEKYIPLALTILYFLLSIGYIMMLNSNYFLDPATFELYIKIGTYFYLLLTACVLVIGMFIYIAERIIRQKVKHVFTIYFCIVALCFYVFKFINLPYLGFYILLLIPFGVLMGLFAYHLIWKASGKIRQKMFIVTIGYITAIVAVVLTIQFLLVSQYTLPFDPNKYIIPLEIKITLLIASILTGYGFYTIPSFTEFDWKEKIRHLYILSPQGLCLFQQSFQKGAITDEDLFGGSLMAIQSLMQEMIQSDKVLRAIDHQDTKIIFEQSPHVVLIMVAEEELYIVRLKLQQLAKEVELFFGDILVEWDGDLNLFKPLQPIVNKIFEIQ
jgi:hypothetical protein